MNVKRILTALRIYDINPTMARNSLPKLSRKHFEQLGIPVASFDRDAVVPTTPALDFPKDPAEREASTRLKTLLNVR